MINFKHMKISHRLYWGFGTGVFALILLSILSYVGFSRIYTEAELVFQFGKLDEQIMSAEVDHLRWDKQVLMDIIDPDIHQITVEVDPHKCAFGQWYYSDDRREMEQFAPFIKTPLAELEAPHAQLHESIKHLNQLLAEEGGTSAAQTYFITNVAPIIQEVTSRLEEMKSQLYKQEYSNEGLVHTTKSQQRLMEFLGIGFSILLVLIAFFLGRNIVAVLRQAVAAISSASSEISATIEEQERTAAQQSAAVNQTTTTMEELDVSSRQSANQAEQAANSTTEVMELTQQGSQYVNLAQQATTNLRDRVGGIAEQILRLSEQTSQIQNITNLVSDLANQTNLLALNAAVEAARAGEHGKGFAVVATEIRKLADESKKSAERINTLVLDIQQATNSTVMVTEEGTKMVDEVTRASQQNAEIFNRIAVTSETAAQNVQQITLNVQQQAAAIKQVVSAMTSINAGARETAAGITQSKVGIQSINEVSQKLAAMI